MKILMVLFLWCGFATAQEKSDDPVIEKLELGLDHTVGEAIEVVRQAALKKDRFFAFAIDLQKHELAAPFGGRLSLRNVPASVALYYICDSCRLEHIYQNGMWTIRTLPDVAGQDEIQMRIEDITPAEYTALGLRFEKENLVTEDGRKWPAGELAWASRIENRLIIRALPEKIETLKALLLLHRAGYPIPKINQRKEK